MLASKGKISLRQLMFILFTITYTLSMRALPVYTAKTAHQAAWLSPLVTFAAIVPVIIVFSNIFTKYKEASFAEIIEDILGRPVGKAVTILYIILLTFLLVIDTRNYAEKLVSSIFPDVKIVVFIAVMLAFVAFTLHRGGLVVLARMNEIILPILVTIFLFLFILALKDIKISRLTPVSSMDFSPVLQANTEGMVIFSYFTFLFLLSDYVNNKEKVKKVCLMSAVILASLLIILLIITIGMLGASTIELTQVPYITAIKQISLFQTLERIESAVVSQWVFSDFMLISILILIVVNLFKSLFKLSDIKPFMGIYSVIAILLALMIARNSNELELLIEKAIIPLDILLGFAVPVVVFLVGKLRKKL